ncbi:ankyrin repeat domain-containing protein [Rickettsia honei]|uniref:ankyrin repeat domain-containing protein n=1 Tax=Rickettsia honei TaxID=37816 RepID=UPI001EE68251|nr:ankyrin repeat domain-containing protein [Rickettsia honei]
MSLVQFQPWPPLFLTLNPVILYLQLNFYCICKLIFVINFRLIKINYVYTYKKIFGIHKESTPEESDEILYNQLISLLEKLIDKIKNTNLFNQSDEDGNTALILAADAGLEEGCLKIIPKMSDEAINTIENIRGQPALTKAMWRDLDNVCIELIPRMFEENINSIDKFGRTLLMLASKKGIIAVSLEFIKLLPPEMIIRADNNGNMAASYADTDKAFAEVRELLQEKQQNLLKNLASFLNKTFL